MNLLCLGAALIGIACAQAQPAERSPYAAFGQCTSAQDLQRLVGSSLVAWSLDGNHVSFRDYAFVWKAQGCWVPENAQRQPLCIDGHVTKRPRDVTYGGLPSRHGEQRDHVVPLELGGPDIASNVRYQRCDATGEHGRCLAGPAKLKDDDEHMAGEKMCEGKWTLDYAREWLAARWPVDAAHGY